MHEYVTRKKKKMHEYAYFILRGEEDKGTSNDDP